MQSDTRPKSILRLLHQQQFRCAYTGDPLTPETTGADHRLPVSRGGTHDIGNIALVLRKVNTAKGTMTVDEFREMCQKVVNHLGKVELKDQTETVDDLSGCDDPMEILTRLGYFNAAEKYRIISARLKSNEGYRGRFKSQAKTLDEQTEKKLKTLNELREEIQKLQIYRSVMKRRLSARSDAI